jgi:23S rRNA pseudouridine2605 synthase
MPEERLQKLLARAGFGSRRASEQLIKAGRVTVDGEVATLGMRADTAAQRIEVDGTPLPGEPEPLTLMLNKPEGFLVTASDDQGRRTVFDLLENVPPSLRYIGRLDRDSSGLLLLTTDGELAFRLSHPRYEVVKRYEVTVNREPAARALDRLRAGIELEDGPSAPAEIDVLYTNSDGVRLRISIHEGRKRQVRRMLRAVGYGVSKLERVEFAGLKLGKLASGKTRVLNEDELQQLRGLVGLLDVPAQP